MGSSLKDEREYFIALCTATRALKYINDNFHEQRIKPRIGQIAPLARRGSLLASLLLPMSQTEREFVSWREDLKNLDFALLRESETFQKLYNEKIADKVKKPLEVISDDGLTKILYAIISKYAHRNFSGATNIQQGLSDVDQSINDIKDALKDGSFADVGLSLVGKLDESRKKMLAKSVTLVVRSVFENGQLRNLSKREQFEVKIDLSTKDFFNLAYVFSQNYAETQEGKDDLFKQNLIAGFRDFSGKSVEEGVEFFLEHFDEMTKGTEYESFTKDQRISLEEVLHGMLEFDEFFKTYQEQPLEEKEFYQNQALVRQIIPCVLMACKNCNFDRSRILSSKRSSDKMLSAFNSFSQMKSEDEKTFIQNGGFGTMYTELLLTCVETMIQIFQNENNEEWFQELSKRGVIKEILEDVSEEGEYTCNTLFATMRNSIVHGKYIVLPGKEQEFGVEFYDEDETVKVKRGEEKVYESKFILGMSDLDNLLEQGIDFLMLQSRDDEDIKTG